MIITRSKVKETIDNVFSGGKMATVTFIKKDGSERIMNCRRKVVKYLKGGKSNIAHKQNLVSVYDVKAEGYRCINIETVKEIKGNGNVYVVKG